MCAYRRTPRAASPLTADGRSELGAHVDGYAANVGDTIVVGETEVTGRKADLITAARVAGEAALRLLKPGKTVRRLRLPRHHGRTTAV